MFSFMAGTSRTGARVLIAKAETSVEQSPLAIRARVVAVAGYTTTASAQSAKAMCTAGSLASSDRMLLTTD